MVDQFRAPLTEQYRPQSWEDVIGQEKVINRFLALRKRGLAGRAFWLSGQSGTGKTTIARLIAAEVADEFCIQEVDAAGLTVSALRDLEREMNVKGWGEKGGRAYVINEAHGLRKDVIRQLARSPGAHPVPCRHRLHHNRRGTGIAFRGLRRRFPPAEPLLAA